MQITDHKVAGNEKNELYISVVDKPGSGGAHHKYRIEASLEQDFDGDGDFKTFIKFQNGPIPENGINGVTQEVLLAIVAHRLQCFQDGPFPSPENEAALAHTVEALEILKKRTRDRIARAVEGKLEA